MATPHVAAVAALVWSHNKECTSDQIRAILSATATHMNGQDSCDQYFGYGMVQAKAAIDALINYGCDAGSPSVLLPGDDKYFSGCQTIPPLRAAPTSAPSFPPTPVPCDKGHASLDLTLTTDIWGGETSWELLDANGNSKHKVPAGTLPSEQTRNDALDVCACQNYTFTIKDTWGDGICCLYGNGSYELKYNGQVLALGGEFGAEESTSFTVDAGGLCISESPTPAPSKDPTPSPTSNPTSGPTSIPPSLLSLPTYLSSNPYNAYGIQGYFFDSTAGPNDAVAIESITFYAMGEGLFNLYTKQPDSISDGTTFGGGEDAWDLLTSTPLLGRGRYQASFEPPLYIPAGQSRPFHLYNPSGLAGSRTPGDAWYGQGQYPPFVSDNRLTVSHNFAVPYLFQNSFYGGYNLNGASVTYTTSAVHTDHSQVITRVEMLESSAMGMGEDVPASPPAFHEEDNVCKPKDAFCTNSSECCSGNCHGNEKCE